MISRAKGIALLGLLEMLVGCGQRQVGTREARATPLASGKQQIRVILDSFYFEPNRILVEANKPVEIVLKGDTLLIGHNFSLHAPETGIDVDQDVSPRGEARVQFTPTKSGEYRFFCHKDKHAQKGMVGVLVVQ